jgi:aromatic-L-amino-acid decarboxylase
MPRSTSWPTISRAFATEASCPEVEPGSLRPLFPQTPPESPEPMGTILADYRRLFEPNVTHWQHPRFLAYFASSASGPGIIGEMLTSVLNSNPDAVADEPGRDGTRAGRRRLDPPGARPAGRLRRVDHRHRLHLLDAGPRRGAPGGRDRCRGEGPAGARDVPQLRVYCSEEAHSSIEKACMTLGLGRAGVDEDPDQRSLRAAPRRPRGSHRRRQGRRRPPDRPRRHDRHDLHHVARPDRRNGEDRRREGMWLHVDAAYAGVVAIIPELRGPFEGWEEADSIVTNAHKWWFAPVDASILLTRRMPVLRDAFSLVPEYLRTLDREGADPRLQRVHAHAGPPAAGPEAVDAPALLRPGGPAPARQAPPGDGRAVAAGSTPTPTSNDGAGAVLDGLLPVPAGRSGGREDEPASPRRSTT